MTQDIDTKIRRILGAARVIAVVGWSPNPDRPSHRVAAFLKSRGYRVIPVNPGVAGQSALGETVRATLADIDAPVDLVDIFRRSEDVPPVVEQALRLPGVKAVWMQLGIRNAEAARLAEAAGVEVIEDRCPAIEIPRLGL
ncbi:CoA-binding protein [Gemmobacter caeruleus]|uniref:CoA-binding protein n=1 Tax=Gemmobacter caeruleus TaxID=2595004 RepID=UPI0011EFFB85|nr:CoA-binding protein [Gemmobacter caeruleus]